MRKRKIEFASSGEDRPSNRPSTASVLEAILMQALALLLCSATAVAARRQQLHHSPTHFEADQRNRLINLLCRGSEGSMDNESHAMRGLGTDERP